MAAAAGLGPAHFWIDSLFGRRPGRAAEIAQAASSPPPARRLSASPAVGERAEREVDPGVLPKRLPLYHRQGSVVLLDDAPDFLEALVPVLPRRWNIETFFSAESCLNYLQQQPPLWEADLWAQQRIVDEWRAGEPIIQNVLRYWLESPDRFALTKVCIIDHLMPGMTGLEMLEELVEWPGQRLLLTGEFDAQMATAAFNRGAIDYFLPKQTPHVGAAVSEAVDTLMNRPDVRHHQVWASTLTPEQVAVLRTPSIAQDLMDFVSRSFIEWVVIGKPFGILGLGETGLTSWLQLQPTQGLEHLAELAREHGASAQELADIRAGRCVHDVELRADLRSLETAATTPAFYVGDTGTLLAGLHRITEVSSPAALSYYNWLRRQAQRRAQNQSRF